MSNRNIAIERGFPRVPLKNGIGRYMPQLKRIVIKFCKSQGTSKGVREFIENDLLDYTRSHPATVVYLKPRRHRSPVAICEYLNGERLYFPLHQFTRDEVLKWVNMFYTRSGMPDMRYMKLWHTDIPSIQGVWTPFTNKDPALNIATFPLKELSKPAYVPKSATEKVLEMYSWQKLKEDEERERVQRGDMEIPVQN